MSILSRTAAAEHAHPADRCAREIIAILALSYAARLRQLMRNPFGRQPIHALPRQTIRS